MSFRRNIVANYCGQIYVTIVGIVMVPMYIRDMGPEAYGLVGFFSMLQAWFNLLDLGMSPTIARESARYHGGVMTALDYRRVFRALSVLFSVIALLGGGVLWVLSDAVAARWLKVDTLPGAEVAIAVQIMAVSVALRWMTGLYRGVVTGSERFVWLSSFTALIATLRFVGVLGSMSLWGYTPRVFFVHQLVVAAIETGGLFWMSHRLLPNRSELGVPIGWSLRSVQPLLKFALTIAFTSSVWVLVTQTDKLVLSGILPLAEYGYFTLAVLVSSGIMIISGPISSAIMPRMARLHAENNNDELIRIYRQATQCVSAIAGSVAVTLIYCAEPMLFAWSGSAELAAHAAPILKLYAIGNGILAVSAFPYYLQYAKGDLHYHLIGNAVMVVFLVPCIVYAAAHFGGIGAGYVWAGINALYLFTWLAYVHHKFEPGVHWKWLWQDIIRVVSPAFVLVILAGCIRFDMNDRVYMAIVTVVFGILCATSIAIATPSLRKMLLNHAISR